MGLLAAMHFGSTGNDAASDEQRRAATMLGFRPKRVTPEMINTVSNMFPDIPIPNVHYDLLRTGNVELTTNKILERGFLESPPAAFHTLYPLASATNQGPFIRTPSTSTNASPTSKAPAPKAPSLVERYGLEERVQRGEQVAEESVGGKAQWEDSPEKREASLKERKAQMILAARQYVHGLVAVFR
ncbi:hypothetical protein H1R20_g11392, partial [Candolleomyces eurysporus]